MPRDILVSHCDPSLDLVLIVLHVKLALFSNRFSIYFSGKETTAPPAKLQRIAIKSNVTHAPQSQPSSVLDQTVPLESLAPKPEPDHDLLHPFSDSDDLDSVKSLVDDVGQELIGEPTTSLFDHDYQHQPEPTREVEKPSIFDGYPKDMADRLAKTPNNIYYRSSLLRANHKLFPEPNKRPYDLTPTMNVDHVRNQVMGRIDDVILHIGRTEPPIDPRGSNKTHEKSNLWLLTNRKGGFQKLRAG